VAPSIRASLGPRDALAEIQANAFAAEVLMPRDRVLSEARRLLEAGSEASMVSDLAQGFDVSEQAMEYRLINLGLRRQV